MRIKRITSVRIVLQSIKEMDIQQIELRYSSELAVLKSQKESLTKRLKEIQRDLGLTDEQLNSEAIESMIQSSEVQLKELEENLEASKRLPR